MNEFIVEIETKLGAPGDTLCTLLQ